MSIVPVKKVTLYGAINEKEKALEHLQELGCLHIIPLQVSEDLFANKDTANRPQEALRYLQESPVILKQIKDTSSFDAAKLERAALQNKNRKADLEIELDELKAKIDDLRPFGNFVLPPAEHLGGLKLFFYKIPLKDYQVQRQFTEINRDNLAAYVVVAAKAKDESIPYEPLEIGSEPLQQLEKKLDAAELELEYLQAERQKLTHWLSLYEDNVAILEDQAARQIVSKATHDESTIFALQAWAPSQELANLQQYADQQKLALIINDPKPGEVPPTLLANSGKWQGGEDLLTFYMTPNYWLWDPSVLVLFSFAVFFAMILADAGYALLLGLIVALYWKKMGQSPAGQRFRIVLATLVVFSVIWGVIVGSYFGIELPENHFLKKLQVVDMQDYTAMMKLAICVGATHILLANLGQAWALRKSPVALANIGWALVLIGAMTGFFLNATIGIAIGVTGLLAIILFTSLEKPAWKRVLKGFVGLTRISSMFGDVLSYLRLFALGLASAALAGIFNNMAKQAYIGLPGFKILFALLILLVGHAMNFGLSLMSGFIHGLRLNYIEFFNWGLPEEGETFKAFSKKEKSKWNR